MQSFQRCAGFLKADGYGMDRQSRLGPWVAPIRLSSTGRISDESARFPTGGDQSNLIKSSLSWPRLRIESWSHLIFLTLSFFAVAIPARAQTPTPPFTQCPAAGLDTSCRILILIKADGGQRVLTDPNVSPTYDGADDTLIGVVNQSSTPISSIPLTAPNVIFGFDGDGICSSSINPKPAGCPFGPTLYEGPGVSFTSINAAKTSGVVVFNPPIPANGGTAYFGLEVAIPTQCADADGDGLCDDWERNGLTVVVNGVPVFIDLPAMGADPNHKDIFIQADFMANPGICIPLLGCFFGHTHQPKLDAVALVTQAFANAPVNNPDGTTGIRLHVDCGPNCIMNPLTSQTWGAMSQAHTLAHQDSLGTAPGNNYDWTAFDAIKKVNFSFARQQVFHYLVFAHNLGGLDGTSGISRGITASDFIVSLGSWDNQIGTSMQQAGTLMHELGHNLSLQHGGSDGVNYKPNFLSVMNYFFQMGGVVINGAQGTLDYSRFLLPSLNENSLNEAVGLNGGAPIANYGTMYYCQGAGMSTFVATANNPIDWNCNGVNNEANVATDVNRDGVRTVLTTFNDWPNLVFNGGAIGGLGIALTPPVQTPIQPEVSPTIDSQITKPLKVMVASPGATQMLAGGSADLMFTITNGGTQNDSYSLTAASTVNWGSLAGVPASVSLNAGASTQITIPVTVPAGTPTGSIGHFTINAASVTSSNIQDTGDASVSIVGGTPRLTASILSQSTNGTTMTLNLQIINQGPGPGVNTTITSFSARTLSGSGTVTVAAPSVPSSVGNLAVGGVAVVVLTLNVPSSVSRFSLVQNGNVQDAGGTTYTYSTSEVVQK
jgi:hypothetical protein